MTALLTALLTASLLAKLAAVGLRHEQVPWSASKAVAETREAERARNETSGSMLLIATAIVMSDDKEKNGRVVQRQTLAAVVEKKKGCGRQLGDTKRKGQ